jgi:hypothetical protein
MRRGAISVEPTEDTIVPMDPETVIETRVDEDGVSTILLGHVVSARVRAITVDCLRHFMPEVHSRYRQLKYPNGPDSANAESRQRACKYALAELSAFVLKYYLRVDD